MSCAPCGQTTARTQQTTETNNLLLLVLALFGITLWATGKKGVVPK